MDTASLRPARRRGRRALGRATRRLTSALLVIARRAALESFNDRLTRLMNLVFALVVPIGLVSLVIRPLLRRGQLADRPAS